MVRQKQVGYLLAGSRRESSKAGACQSRGRGRGIIRLAGLVLLLTPHALAAQRDTDLGPLVYDRFTTEHGLPVNSVNGVLQSRDGYIWAATFDGLARFDGIRFTIFNTGNSDGLPSNRLLELRETRDGALWLVTEGQRVVRFREGRFVTFGPEQGVAEQVLRWTEDAGGRLWLGTRRGLLRVEGDRAVAVGPHTIRGNVNWLAAGRSAVWVLTSESAFRITGDSVVPFRPPGLESAMRALFEDPAGRLWIGTEREVFRADVAGGALERVLTLEHPGDAIQEFAAAPGSGVVWIATRHATYRIEGGVGHVSHRRYRDVDRPDLLRMGPDGAIWHGSGGELFRDGRPLRPAGAGAEWTGAGITALAWDHEGSLWLGTGGAGLFQLRHHAIGVHGTPEGLSADNVYAVYEDRAGDVWLGLFDTGLARISSDGSVTNFDYSMGRGYPPLVSTVLQDRPDRMLVGTFQSGLHRCSLPNPVCRRDAALPAGSTVFALHQDPRGAVWAGLDAGLFRRSDAVWTRLREEDGAPTAPVRAFLSAQDGSVWMGTNGGGVVRWREGRFDHLTVREGLPGDLVRALYQDRDGIIWIGTEGWGLVRLDPAEWPAGGGGVRVPLTVFRRGDGLFHDVIHQILEDDAGRLWMNSNGGIFRVRRAELNAAAARRGGRIHSVAYTERDGLRNREGNGGVQPAGVRTRDGRLWFATQEGVAVVDPRVRDVPPPVTVERLVAADREIVPGRGRIELAANERDLEVDYTALSFLSPQNVQFRYRLEPYDDDWVDAGSRRNAFYTRLPAGRYTFRVAASAGDGVWSERPAAIALVIEPRFHETTLARVLGLAAVLLAAAAALRWRDRHQLARARTLQRLVDERTAQLREREQLLLRQADQLEELDRAKSRFFANLSHEFRTPLTLIMGPLRSLLDGRHGPLGHSAKDQAELMLRNSHRLLRIINQVLDLARLQAGSLELDRRPLDLTAFVRDIVHAFVPLAERRGIALVFAPVREVVLPFDSEQLEKVVLNLLSNALKFTGEGGSVRVTVVADEAQARIIVRDDGVGIAPEELERIFERFHQADAAATRRYEGSGIGLSLARELAELHGGDITVESTPGMGSTFTVHLPRIAWNAAALSASEAGRGAPRSLAEITGASPSSGTRAEDTCDGVDADRTTVLVVDDNDDVRAYIRSILAPSFRVIEARDGRSGLEAARAELPDLIVADIMMPELDGLEMGRALKLDAMTDAIPVVLLTARAEAEDQVAGLETGADAYVLKPFDPDVLEATVNGILAQRRRLRERFRDEATAARAGKPPEEAEPVVAGSASVSPVSGGPPPRSDAGMTPTGPPAIQPSALVNRLRAIVRARLLDSDLGPDALAEAAGLSYHQLYRALRDELATTPSRLIRTVRVELADELLRGGAGSVTEVAYSVGFQSLSYFSRAYRERFGASPTEHMKGKSLS